MSQVEEELCGFCINEEISVDILRERIEATPQNVLARSPPVVHWVCLNEKVTLEVVEYLLHVFPRAASFATELPALNGGITYPLHIACNNIYCPSSVIRLLWTKYRPALEEVCVVDKDGPDHGLPLHFYLARTSNLELDMVRELVDAYPQALRTVGDEEDGGTPLETLIWNDNITELHDVVRFLIGADPTSVRIPDGDGGSTAVHLALLTDDAIDPEVVNMLLESYPEAANLFDSSGQLPIHALCGNPDVADADDAVDALGQLIEVSPPSVREVDTVYGYLPIHFAIQFGKSADFCKLLLEAHPESVTRTDYDGSNNMTLLHFACMRMRSPTCPVIQLLFDAYPEAILLQTDNGKSPLDCAEENEELEDEVVQFLETQMTYARTAQDRKAMTTLDSNEWLPLHNALRDNATLGAIKLLVRANPSALRVADRFRTSFPLHIACKYSSTDVVRYLLKLDATFVNHCDANKDTPLHYACRGVNCGVVKLLLESDPSSVSERNVDGKLPFHLICETENQAERDSIVYVDAIWRLLLAHPQTVVDY